MNGLMLHCGAKALGRMELAGFIPPAPRGSYHNPVPYIETVELVTDALSAIGFRIKEEAFGALSDGSRFFGLMAVEPDTEVLEGELLSPEDYDLLLGLRGSYDQTFPRGFACGARVFVCDNLSFSGEVVVHTKQTTNINKRMPPRIEAAMHQIVQMGELQALRFDRYRNEALNRKDGDAVIVDLLRHGVIGVRHAPRVIQEWDNPSHPEHLAWGRTVWTLHNAVTEAIKPGNGQPTAIVAQNRTLGLTRHLDKLVRLEAPETLAA
jgi:hypothetical protein